MRTGILLSLCLLFIAPTAMAQTADQTFERRLELAEQMLEIHPVKEQVNRAIDRYIQSYMLTSPEGEQERFRAALTRVLNYKALERVSLDAYAEIFTEAELEAMVEYYAKPEAQSARLKLEQFNGRIYPEIIRMMDQTIIRARTQGQD